MKVETKHQGVSQAKERRTAFDIETMDGHATLGSILHELGNQRTTIPMNSLSRSARTVLQRVIYRSLYCVLILSCLNH